MRRLANCGKALLIPFHLFLLTVEAFIAGVYLTYHAYMLVAGIIGIGILQTLILNQAMKIWRVK